MISFGSLVTAAFVVLICLKLGGVWQLRKQIALNLPEETSYYNDFDLMGCTGRQSLNGTYAVNKYSQGCFSNSTDGYPGTVPVLFTSSFSTPRLFIKYPTH